MTVKPRPSSAERMRLMLGMKGLGYTYEEIGKDFGISRQRVWSLLQPALRAEALRARRERALEREPNPPPP